MCVCASVGVAVHGLVGGERPHIVATTCMFVHAVYVCKGCALLSSRRGVCAACPIPPSTHTQYTHTQMHAHTLVTQVLDSTPPSTGSNLWRTNFSSNLTSTHVCNVHARTRARAHTHIHTHARTHAPPPTHTQITQVLDFTPPPTGSNLRRVDFSSNLITSIQDISHFSRLTHLNLDRNRLEIITGVCVCVWLCVCVCGCGCLWVLVCMMGGCTAHHSPEPGQEQAGDHSRWVGVGDHRMCACLGGGGQHECGMPHCNAHVPTSLPRVGRGMWCIVCTCVWRGSGLCPNMLAHSFLHMQAWMF